MKTEDLKKIGFRIVERRKELKLTQEQIEVDYELHQLPRNHHEAQGNHSQMP